MPKDPEPKPETTEYLDPHQLAPVIKRPNAKQTRHSFRKHAQKIQTLEDAEALEDDLDTNV